VTDVNRALSEKPEAVNTAPHESWMIAIKVSSGAEDLLDAAQYADLTK
jgi:glycine cleavage system H lipoate-binding protein